MYRTWSKYLLEEKFDQDSQTNFEGGRYGDLVRESQSDVLVNRGLAEIHLLDKQVHSQHLMSLDGIQIPIFCILCVFFSLHCSQINNLDKKARQLPGSGHGGRKGRQHAYMWDALKDNLLKLTLTDLIIIQGKNTIMSTTRLL